MRLFAFARAYLRTVIFHFPVFYKIQKFIRQRIGFTEIIGIAAYSHFVGKKLRSQPNGLNVGAKRIKRAGFNNYNLGRLAVLLKICLVFLFQVFFCLLYTSDAADE